jgi:hypothetical protein
MTSNTAYVLTIVNATHTHLHVIEWPGMGEPGYYRQAVSIEGFRHRMMRARAKEQERRYTIRRKNPLATFPAFTHYLVHLFADDFDEFCKAWSVVRDLRTLPTSVHKSVWDFYTAIGYDHRRNKFAVTERSGSK